MKWEDEILNVAEHHQTHNVKQQIDPSQMYSCENTDCSRATGTFATDGHIFRKKSMHWQKLTHWQQFLTGLPASWGCRSGYHKTNCFISCQLFSTNWNLKLSTWEFGKTCKEDILLRKEKLMIILTRNLPLICLYEKTEGWKFSNHDEGSSYHEDVLNLIVTASSVSSAHLNNTQRFNV